MCIRDSAESQQVEGDFEYGGFVSIWRLGGKDTTTITFIFQSTGISKTIVGSNFITHSRLPLTSLRSSVQIESFIDKNQIVCKLLQISLELLPLLISSGILHFILCVADLFIEYFNCPEKSVDVLP